MISLGRYNLLVKLGQGGMGTVFLARHVNLRRFCAVKIMNPQVAQDPDAAGRFLREARSAAAITHPNLVNIFDCDRVDNQLFLAMEYVEGMSLGEILRKTGPIPLAPALHWLSQAVTALEHIHERGIVHRDIKPDNMLIDREGRLKITDLGLAKVCLEADTGMTLTGMVMGSPHYMSPEQINDSKSVDHRTDLYALGICFFQMLTGRVPFSQTSAAAVCIAHLQEPVPSVGLPDADLTVALDALIGRLTAKRVEERVVNAAEVTTLLQPWLERYRMDETARGYFSAIDFSKRTVDALLEKEGVDPSVIDTDFTLAKKDQLVPAVEPTVVLPPTIAPVAVAPPPSSRRWLFAAAAGVVVLMLLLFAIGKKKQAAQRAQRAAEATGSLLVKTSPDGAIVLFRADSGTSPATFECVPSGEYAVKISKTGYQDAERKVKIEAGKFADLNVTLERSVGAAWIETDPIGAEVIVDGQLLGYAPCRIEGGEGQTVKCTLRHRKFEEASLSVTFTKEAATQRVKLVRDNSQPNTVDSAVPDKPALKPMGAGGPRRALELHQGMSAILNRALAAPKEDWPAARDRLLSELDQKVQDRSPKSLETVARIKSDLATILDEARAQPQGEIQKRHNAFVLRMMMAVAKEAPGGRGGPRRDGSPGE